MFDFLSQKFSSLFSRLEESKKLTDQNIQEALVVVQEALLEADVPYGVAQKFIELVRNDVVGQKVIGSLKPAEQLMMVVQRKIIDFLGGESAAPSFVTPSMIMVMGLQGSGKTTTIGKLAYKIKKDAEKDNVSKKIIVGSIDFYRPAAIDQLEILARQVGVSFCRAHSSDPINAAREIVSFGQSNGYDVILLDTAGRLHVDGTMLQELQEVDALLRPTYKMLVLDAMTGQESLAVAQAFNDTIGFHGAFLSKMDSDTRGGAAFSFRFVLKKPIVFVGEGEKMADLNVFYPDRAADRILGMGDLQTFLERAEEKISSVERAKVEQAFDAGTFSLQDFADQIEMMNRLGSFSKLLQYMPGMGMKVSPEMIQRGEIELVKFRAIIASMTPKERLDQRIMNSSRMQRVAKGAGVEVSDVVNLLKRFEEVKQYVKL